MQRRILDDILARIPPHDAAHGFVLGRSALTHAALHAGRGHVLRCDLRDFFPSGRIAWIAQTSRARGEKLRRRYDLIDWAR